MKIKSITLGSYRRAKQFIAEIESQKETKRHLELEKNNMIDQDAKETIKREIGFLEDNIERFRMELRRIEKNAFGLDWVGTFPEDDVIDAKDHADMPEGVLSEPNFYMEKGPKGFYLDVTQNEIRQIAKSISFGIRENAWQLDKIFTDFVNEDPTEEFDPVPSEMINKAKNYIQKILTECERLKTFVDLIITTKEDPE